MSLDLLHSSFHPAWKPRTDISTYELALCMPVIVASTTYPSCSIRDLYDALPPLAQRHFELQRACPAEPLNSATQSIWDSLKSAASA